MRSLMRRSGTRMKWEDYVVYYVGQVVEIHAGRTVSVRVNRSVVRMKYVAGFSPLIGSTIRVQKRVMTWTAIGPISEGEVVIPAGDDAPDLPGSGTYGPLRPIYAGTWDGLRWVAGEPSQGTRQGAATAGCWFYGTGPSVRLRGGITAVKLRMRGATPRTLGAVQIWPLTQRQRPPGAPNFATGAPITTAELRGTDLVVVTLPGAGTPLETGAWGGFAIYHATPDRRLALSLDLDSLTADMEWST